MEALIAGLFGLIIGSFINVLVLRYPARSLGGRSMCMSCGGEIAWYDNIPLFSWIFLRGHCRRCGSAISVQYPLVEATTGAIFALVSASSDISAGISGLYAAALLIPMLFIAALLIAIATYDIKHTIIPDAWAYTFAATAFLYGGAIALVQPGYGLVLFLLAGPLAALPLFALWLVTKGRWMGLGDSKLALGIGWLLGPLYGPFAVLFAFIIGAVVSVPLLFFSSRAWRDIVARFTPTRASPKPHGGFTMGSEIPFGPFLTLSCIIVWLSLINGIEPLAMLGLLPS